ncbi:MAG: orotidine-5'-phosphate decarboxylase [Bacteroidales bacterium]|nr:orotidine-5'-phosphate decarboxylase [Bacteroidales bacterium]
MSFKSLFQNILTKKSFLCIGLDSDIQKIPGYLNKYKHPVFEFNRMIVDATAPYTIAYKPNIAFYESRGKEGWHELELTVDYIRKNHPGIFLIADAKRGDIGNTSEMYAETFFKIFDFDAVTVSPYMGYDSIQPFFNYKNKWVIILALTSNKGSDDFQMLRTGKSETLFETVLKTSSTWGNKENTMYVVGATHANMLVLVREYVPDHFLLIPGVGAQGGSLEDVFEYGKNPNCGLIVNSSRAIIYAGTDKDFDQTAAQKASEIQGQMEKLLLHLPA